jgi:H+/gluconate symporter-like permease
MASICALIFVFWICYPRFRPIYAAAIAALAGGLIVGNYHFVGDLLAGVFVGISTAVFVVLVWEAAFSRLFVGRVERIRQNEPAVAQKKMLPLI